MNKFTTLSLLIITSLITAPINAAVSIVIKDVQNKYTTLYIDNNKLRVDLPNKEGYIVIDIADNTMKTIIYNQRIVVDMSDTLKGNNINAIHNRYVDTYTKSMGLGPKVSGYETEEFSIYAKDNYCGSLFISVRAMRDVAGDKFAQVLSYVENKMDYHSSAISMQNLEPCDIADRKASKKLRQIGFPLKSINRDKSLDYIVTKISNNITLPKNAFEIPTDYKIVNPNKKNDETMKKVTPEMKEMMKKMTPEMREMMKNMTPEMIEMMKQNIQQ